MQRIHDFTSKNPHDVVTGPIPMSHIIEKLKRDYNAEEMPLELFPTHKIQMQRENAYYYAQDEQIDLQMEDIQIKVVRIPVTDQTKHYTEKDFTVWYANDTKDSNGIYVVYEEKSNYFYCNSSMLHLELTMARGISESDIKNKTEKYREHIGLIQRYIDDYTDLEN